MSEEAKRIEELEAQLQEARGDLKHLRRELRESNRFLERAEGELSEKRNLVRIAMAARLYAEGREPEELFQALVSARSKGEISTHGIVYMAQRWALGLPVDRDELRRKRGAADKVHGMEGRRAAFAAGQREAAARLKPLLNSLTDAVWRAREDAAGINGGEGEGEAVLAVKRRLNALQGATEHVSALLEEVSEAWGPI